MFSFNAAIWLLGLAAVPIIWWLHKLPDLHTTVSAIFLWEKSADSSQSRHLSARTDPRWLIRALIVALIISALAQPQWQTRDEKPVAVWVDNSISMHTVENGRSRIQSAVDQLLAALSRLDGVSVRLSSMSGDANTIYLDEYAGSDWAETIRNWLDSLPIYPPLRHAELTDGYTHWVVTDGADPVLNQWINDSNAKSIISSGEVTENAAVVRLAARRDLMDQDSLVGLFVVHNAGLDSATVQVVVSVDQDIQTHLIDIPPGMSASRSVPIPADSSQLEVHLAATEPLSLDDRLSLSLAPLAQAAAVISGRCNKKLVAALSAHPGLVRMPESVTNAGLVVECDEDRVGTSGVRIRLEQPSTYIPVTADLAWAAEAGSLQRIDLNPSWLRAPVKTSPNSSHIPLLSSNGNVLIAADPTTKDISVFLDMSSPGFTRQPEYPLMIAGLVDWATDVSLFDPIAVNERLPAESTVAAQPGLLQRPPVADFVTLHPRPMDKPLTIIALALLLIELYRHIADIRNPRQLGAAAS